MSEIGANELFRQRLEALSDTDAIRARCERFQRLGDRLKNNSANIAAAPFAGAIALTEKLHLSNEYQIGGTFVAASYLGLVGGILALAYSDDFRMRATQEARQAAQIFDKHGMDREDWTNKVLNGGTH